MVTTRMSSIGFRPLALAAATLCTVLAVGTAGHAAGLKQIGQIALPAPSDQFSSSIVDQASGFYYLPDRTNKSVIIIDTKTDTVVGSVPGFVGVTDKGGDTYGPSNVAVVNGGAEIWATDGDSTVKVIDAKTRKITASISTGGAKRTNELIYDPKNEVVLVTNPDEHPPFLTVISTKPDHKIVAKLPIENATRHIERLVYHPPTGTFFVNVPVLDKQPAKGGLAEVDHTGKLVKMHVIENCNPHGLSQAEGSLLFVGCAAGAKGTDLPEPHMAVFDVAKDALVANIPGIGGAGQTAVNNKIGQYYAAANNNPTGPALGVIDAKTNKLIVSMPTWTGSHTVAVSEANNHVYLATRAKSGPCGGCILVFSPEE